MKIENALFSVLVSLGVLFTASATAAELIDFDDGNPVFIRGGTTSGLCFIDTSFEAQGYLFATDTRCFAYLEYDDENGKSLAPFISGTFSRRFARMEMTQQNGGRFDLLELEVLAGAQRSIRAIGYRGDDAVFDELLTVDAGLFIQKKILNWTDLDRVRFSTVEDIPNAVGIDNVLVASRGAPPEPTTPVLSITNEPTAVEGRYLKFQVALSEPSSENVFFDVVTVDDTALAGQDYLPKEGARMMAAGETQKTIWVKAVDDSDIELNERLYLLLVNPVNAEIDENAGEALGIIVDDDDLSKKVTVSVADAAGVEGDFARFIVSLSEPAENDVKILLTSYDDTATADDYERKSGNRIIPAGTTSKTIWVRLNADGVAEGTEQFTLQVGVVSNNAIIDGSNNGFATGTISDSP